MELLNTYEDIFANNLNDIGKTDILQYDIEIPHEANPVRLQQYNHPYKYGDMINEEVQKLLDADFAKDNNWQFSSILV